MELGTSLIGERRVARRFQNFPEAARRKFEAVIKDYQNRLFSAINAKIPRGRTGAIAAALQGGVDSTPYKVRGWVSLAGGDRNKVILPALALEYGSNTSIKVKEKEGRLLYTVYGRYISPMLVNVGAYERTTNIVAQRFLRDPLDAMSGQVMSGLKQALADATKEV